MSRSHLTIALLAGLVLAGYCAFRPGPIELPTPPAPPRSALKPIEWETIRLYLETAPVVTFHQDGSMTVRGGQETPPDQPHTSDPAQCKRYCYPKGGPDMRPKGTPEGIPGYECKGEKCARINEEHEGGEDDRCSETGGCTSHCSKVCCTCLQTCL